MARSSAKAQIARAMSEADFQANVIDAAMKLGWQVHAERPARTAKGWRTAIQGDSGFPDLVLCRGRVLFRELKSERGVLSEAQIEWHERLLAAGADWAVWRPSMMDGIVEELQA